MGILPEHAALLSELGEGELSYTLAGKTEAARSPAATSRFATTTCACWRTRYP